MANNFQRRAPRRPIEKVNNVVVVNPVTQAVIEDILHTADESETLVRAIVDMTVLSILEPTSVFSWTIQIAPKGTIISTPTTGESLDAPMANEDVLGGTMNMAGAGGIAMNREIKVDSSGMRKLKRGDQIVLQTTSNPTNSVALAGTIKLFFKE